MHKKEKNVVPGQCWIRRRRPRRAGESGVAGHPPYGPCPGRSAKRGGRASWRPRTRPQPSLAEPCPSARKDAAEEKCLRSTADGDESRRLQDNHRLARGRPATNANSARSSFKPQLNWRIVMQSRAHPSLLNSRGRLEKELP
jgi:hypothetical protein